MPELPKMENYKNLLTEKIGGEVIDGIQINREKSIKIPTELFIKNVKNHKVMGISRRGKHLLFIQYVLTDAIKHGGYMAHPFYNGDTLTGGYDQLCQVYDREGENCRRCGAVIKKEMLSSRKTFFCPNCQY